MRTRRIAMLSYHTCPLAAFEGKETGGMNVYVLELSQALARLGHEVHIYTRCQDPTNPEVVSVNENVTLFHIPAGPATTLSKTEMLQHIPEFATNVANYIATHHYTYDIVHGHYYMSGLVEQQLRAQHIITAPLVMSFHTLALMKQLIARDEAERDSQERVDAERMLAHDAAAIIAPSESDAEYLEYLYDVHPDHVAIIPPGVNLDLFYPIDRMHAKQHIGADPDHKLILFVGRIEPLKGIDVLFYALKIMARKYPNLQACLWIVGGDVSQPVSSWSEELQRLEQLRHTLSIETNVKFVGQQKQAELLYYYNASEVVVMPSHYESFGMAAAEAMACGTPVITTNVAGIAMFLDEHHQSLITSVSNPLLLADQIATVLQNHSDHVVQAKRLREKVGDLRWDVVAGRIAEVYERAIKKSHKEE